MAKAKISLGIEVGDSSLKLVLLDRAAKKVLRMGVVTTEAHPLREVHFLEKTIADWVSGYENDPSLSIALSLPARLGVVRLVDIPRDVKDITEYVNWEFDTCVNNARSDYYLDYQIGKTSKRKIAMVAGVRKVWLESLRKGFDQRQLLPSVVEIDAYSLQNLMECLYGFKKLQCAVKVDTTGVIALWAKDSCLLSLRWVSVSSLSRMGREEAFAQLTQELTEEMHRGFDQVGLEDASGQVVHLCGDLSVEEDFVAALRKSSPDFLYHLLDSFGGFQLDPDGAPLEMAPLCAGAIGAALRYQGDTP